MILASAAPTAGSAAALCPADRTKGQASRWAGRTLPGRWPLRRCPVCGPGRGCSGEPTPFPPPPKTTSYGGPWPSEPLRLQGSQPTLATLRSKPTRLGPGLTDVSAAPGSSPSLPVGTGACARRIPQRVALPGELHLPQSQSTGPPPARGGGGGGPGPPGAGHGLPRCRAGVLLGRTRSETASGSLVRYDSALRRLSGPLRVKRHLV